MITFTIPGAALPRLARLVLATDTDAPGPLRHIALRVTTNAVRFSAIVDGYFLPADVPAIYAAGLIEVPPLCVSEQV